MLTSVHRLKFKFKFHTGGKLNSSISVVFVYFIQFDQRIFLYFYNFLISQMFVYMYLTFYYDEEHKQRV